MLRNAGAPDEAVQLPNMDIPTAPVMDQEGLAFSYHPSSSGSSSGQQQGMNQNQNQMVATYKVRYCDKGIVCNDPLANNDSEALIKFFIENCSQLKLFIRVQGYHYKTRYWTRTNADGSTSTESYQECVEDFNDNYDVSGLVLPMGFIYASPDKQGNFAIVPQLATQIRGQHQQVQVH